MSNQFLDPESSPLFTPWTDPQSGVVSYILTARCAPWQQAFYFTNHNVSHDGRYLWLYVAFPPSPGHVLGVVDLGEQTVRAFPETHFVAEAPFIDPQTGEAYWAAAQDVFKRGPGPDDPVHEIGRVPDSLFAGTKPRGKQGIRRVTTHLTRSADGALVNLDLIAGDTWHMAVMELATGEVEIWQSFPICYKHAQFSPTDPRLLMLCQDWWHDIKTGEHFPYRNRIWLLRQGEPAYPLFEEASGKNVARHSHEWWPPHGNGIWFVDYDHGTEYVDLRTGEHTNVWPNGTCHSHASADDQLLVGDIGTYQRRVKPLRVAFFNRATGGELSIVSAMPEPPTRAYLGYHPDPHPQFILDDEFIAYTTTVRGSLDFALVRVSDLVARTA